MTINQFRADKDCQQGWDDMLKNHALVRLAIQTLENEHPDRAAVVGDLNGDISPTRAGIELGVNRGYSMFLHRLRVLAVPQAQAEGLPESEYKPETVPREELPSTKPKPKKKK